MRELFELCGADRELLFSPYCWRVRLALAHKGLDCQSRPIHFTDKEAIAFSGQKLVPVLTDGDEAINDSLAIFAYLDRRYPAQPLLGDAQASQRARLVEKLSFHAVRMPLLKMLVPRVWQVIDPVDRDYFRSTREKALGMSLEAFADPEGGERLFREAIAPLESWLSEQPYLDGQEAGGCDYLLAGLMFWAWCLGVQPWADDSAFGAWFSRILQAYESTHGPVRRAPTQVEESQ
ncbi:Beta-etherase [Pseudomonas sp. THAF187a]|uniref:glutathione S-transferase family protein n=1 Tax=unclassified Pseudomonas TaxID=196821 RepID=UPI0012693F0B|nr:MULTISPECIES: glutathione S-transferase N-terminal domain-containing protein [unclassified Pseudomonas]QFT20405.1 Beta-etherase [Pseudomonas sp. THAF187a]QFT40595.1 Beta-etherase [Pseudomonas sp. THAF42]